MRRREAFIGAGLGAVAGLVVSPLLQLVISLLVGEFVLTPTMIGAALATAFFGVSAMAAGIFQNSPHLRTAVMMTYLVKTAALFISFQQIQMDQSDRTTIGISIIVSAVLYLVAQTLWIARFRFRYRHGNAHVSRGN